MSTPLEYALVLPGVLYCTGQGSRSNDICDYLIKLRIFARLIVERASVSTQHFVGCFRLQLSKGFEHISRTIGGYWIAEYYGHLAAYNYCSFAGKRMGIAD